MTITQLLAMPIDKEKSKCGGFQLTIKTARKNRKVDGKTVQQVVLSDSSGEIPGDVFMPNPKQCSYLPRTTVINVVVCWLQPGENGPKLYVDEWFLPKAGVGGFGDLPPDFVEDEFIVRGKCRYGVVCALLRSGMNIYEVDKHKEIVNKWVDFIVTGE